MNKDKWYMELLSYIVCILIFLWCGFVVMMLWNWFIVPIGLMRVNLAHALGIDCLVTFLVTLNPKKIADEASKNIKDKFTWGFVFPASMLLVGWIVRLFM